jgi:hypothetical protein
MMFYDVFHLLCGFLGCLKPEAQVWPKECERRQGSRAKAPGFDGNPKK